MGGTTALGAAAAIWWGLWIGNRLGPWPAAVAAGIAALLVWVARRAPDRVGTVALALALVGAGAARGAAARGWQRGAASRLVADATAEWIRVRVADHPWQEATEPVALLELRADAVLPRGARVRLRFPEGSDLEWGDTLRVLARLDAPRPVRTPGGFSARDAAWAQAVVAQGRALATTPTPRRGSLARASIARWRRGLERCFARELSPATREIVTPLVIGDRSRLGTELDAHLKAAGLTHLIALSGLHIAWMAAVARGLAALVGGGVAARAWAGAACALFYAAIAGPLPSLARAVATEAIAALASLRGRAIDPVQALALSATVLLVLAPGWAEDLGFQLSCAATLGLVVLGRRAAEALAGAPRWVAVALRPLVPTAAAQVTALPIVFARFHALPWTGLGANLVGVPVCELLLAAAWLGAALDLLLPGAGAWCFGACEWLGAALRAVAGVAAAAPCSLLPTGSSPWPAGLAAVGALLVTVAALRGRPALGAPRVSRARFHAAGLGALALALALALGASAPALRPEPGRWWLVVLDVGQGDALALATPRGWWLIDAGPRAPGIDTGAAVILPFFRWAAVRRLDILVLTHDHGDHTGGAAAVREALAVGRVVVPAGARRPRVAPPSAIEAAAGDLMCADPPAWARWPERGFHAPDPNASSLAIEVGSGAGRALLAADVDSLVEAGLDLAPGLAALKVAHHGAATSSGAVFLARARPRIAVVSCGARNPFGHPDPGALLRLASCGARVRRTDRDGAVWLELDDAGAREVAWRDGDVHEGLDARRARAPGTAGPLAGAPARW